MQTYAAGAADDKNALAAAQAKAATTAAATTAETAAAQAADKAEVLHDALDTAANS